jgi:hypothetical protein
MLNQAIVVAKLSFHQSNPSSHRAIELGSNVAMEMLGCLILFKNEISVHIVL